MWQPYANIFGLLLNMTGTYMLFWRGFPQPNFEDGVSIELDDRAVLENGLTVSENEVRMRELKERYTRRSHGALALLFMGFAFQLIAALPLQP